MIWFANLHSWAISASLTWRFLVWITIFVFNYVPYLLFIRVRLLPPQTSCFLRTLHFLLLIHGVAIRIQNLRSLFSKLIFSRRAFCEPWKMPSWLILMMAP